MVTFDIEAGDQGEPRPQFACPRCHVLHRLAAVPGERIRAESLKIRRS
jgi:hypothetical protein